jgi:N-methylhydantoinase B
MSMTELSRTGIAAAVPVGDNRVGNDPIGADPVTTEIVRHSLIAATEEMKTILMRTAYNMVIYEALDFTVGLFDVDGNTLSIGIGLPMFIRGMSNTVKEKIRHFGIDGMRQGDVYLTNDAYITGSHLNHMTFTVPIFDRDTLVGFSCCMAHWPDVGGTLHGLTTDIYSEGLQMPIVKIYSAGVPVEDIFSIIRINVRVPDRAMGDLRAQIAAVKMGERRFLEMLEKYGREQVLLSIRAIMDQSEARARARIHDIPDGVYTAESFMDDDGVAVGKRIPIRVRVTIAGDRMTVDLTDVAAQVSGFYNSGETAGVSCCQVAFKCLTSPLDLPINDGQFRAVEIVLPPGRVVSAVRPSAMRMWMIYPMTVIDTIFKALAPAIPHRVIAGHHADLVITRTSGRRNQDDSLFVFNGLIGGGWGAKHDSDGMSATVAINDGDTHNGPCEQIESKFPMLVERYALRQDSGGAGRFRGGLGTQIVVQARDRIRFNAQIDRVECRPWGLFGGLSGFGNGVAIHRFGADEQRFRNGKAFNLVLEPGDAYIKESGGGGGYGSPLERDPAQIAWDVAEGYVSREVAQMHYGVVFVGESLEIDAAATQARREEMRRQSLPVDPPDATDDAPHDHDHQHHRHDDGPPMTDEERLVIAMSSRCCS